MNRIEEYNQLIQEAAPPENLSEVLARSLNRAHKARTGRRVALCACAPLAVLVVFTALVNLLPGFALACQKVPVIKDLAQAVSFSPSLSAAVDNGYLQRIDQQQIKDGITMRVEYIIADKKQWYIFYKLQQPGGKQRLYMGPEVKDINGNDLQGVSSTWGDMAGDTDNTIHSMAIYFIDQDAPQAVRLECNVYAEETPSETEAPQQSTTDDLLTPPVQPDPIAHFTFELRIDPDKLREGEAYPQGEAFTLDGQKLTLKQVEVYPTHVLVSLADDPSNSAWLKNISLHLEDENGNRYGNVRNGLTATGGINTPMTSNYYIESPYFSNCKRLTLYINGAAWLDKDRQRARIDLANGTAEGLPDGVTLASAKHSGGNWNLEFQQMKDQSPAWGVFDWNYWDEKGREYRFTTSASTSSGGYDGLPAVDTDYFQLVDYPDTIVYMGIYTNRDTTEKQPIVIPVK